MTIEEFIEINRPQRLFIWREAPLHEDDDLSAGGLVADDVSFLELCGRLFLVEEKLDG